MDLRFPSGGPRAEHLYQLTPPFPITYKVTENNPQLGAVIATIRVGPAPEGIAFNPNNGNMYVANTISNTVSVIVPLTTTSSSGCNGTIDEGYNS